jgi:hypothetical protein
MLLLFDNIELYISNGFISREYSYLKCLIHDNGIDGDEEDVVLIEEHLLQNIDEGEFEGVLW